MISSRILSELCVAVFVACSAFACVRAYVRACVRESFKCMFIRVFIRVVVTDCAGELIAHC